MSSNSDKMRSIGKDKTYGISNNNGNLNKNKKLKSENKNNKLDNFDFHDYQDKYDQYSDIDNSVFDSNTAQAKHTYRKNFYHLIYTIYLSFVYFLFCI